MSTAPGPTAREAVGVIASIARDALNVHVTLAARYGDAVRLPVGRGRSNFLFSRPEHAEHVLAVHQDNYVKAPSYRPLRALIGNGLLTSEGEEWRRHRRLVQPLFSRRDVTRFGPAMSDGAQRLLTGWDRLAVGTVLDVAGSMRGLALDIVGQALFGTDMTGDAELMGRAIDAGQRVALLATFVPIHWGPRATRALRVVARRVGHTPEGVEGPVARMIAHRRSHPGAARGDLLDLLLTARAEDGSALTDDEIAAEVSTFMLAGHETSANTLAWSLALVSAFPSARERLEQEADSVLAGRPPEPDDLDRLPWTAAVVAEALRLYPPAWTIERTAVTDDIVGGVAVPAGSQVSISPYLIHRHPGFWPDPAGFDPGRFRPDAPQRPRYAYIPFGGGRRACVGQSFAELETVLVLAAITQRYRLELTARGIPAPVANVTLRPGRGLPMRLLRRRA